MSRVNITSQIRLEVAVLEGLIQTAVDATSHQSSF